MGLTLELLDRKSFSMACIEFQKSIEGEESNELRKLLLENEYLEEEIHKLNQTYTSFKSSVSALSNEILEDLYNSSSGIILPLIYLFGTVNFNMQLFFDSSFACILEFTWHVSH